MRIVVLGILLGSGLVIAACFQRDAAFAQPGSAEFAKQLASDHMIDLSMELGEGNQQMTFVDPKSHVMAVYHIKRNSGEIVLKSVRNFHWDLQMDEFNGESPSPREIRSLLQQR